ncbi:hypothetical protein [Halobacterium litoreum]|uniref:Rhomboid family intramembrane serine protease n=1 Tax=Halobacterium litoreum TaxID=2039234 RepID=A0ABD5NFG3_9EURY|nr:hypothetical protein [Halobacterium litoreum]UHH13310.1 hypothetical protein LT972_14275 [Halobacterium litoreum]
MRARETPDGVRVDGTHALLLVVELDGGEAVRVFESWPSAGHSSSRVARLLAAVGHGAGDPGALSGERVVVVREDDDYRVAVDATRETRASAAPASEDAHSLAEVVVGAGAVAGVLAVLAVGAGYTNPGLALGALAAVVLPVSLGYDAWRTHDVEWSPRPLPWAVGGAVPVLNVAVALAYLVQKAVVVTDPEDPASVWRDVLVGVVAAFAAGLALAAVEPAFPVSLAVFVHAWVFAPVAVFLDARTERHGDRRPRWPAWVAGAVVVGGAGALVYLMRTE